MTDKGETLTEQEAAAILGVPLREVRAVEASDDGTVVTVQADVKHLIRADGSTALVNRTVEGYPSVAAPDDSDGEARSEANAALQPASTKDLEPRKTTGRGGR